jgi:hypothetical protein
MSHKVANDNSNAMIWLALKPIQPDDLGFLPMIFTDSDPRPAIEQAEDRYSHGGGWRPIDGFVLNRDKTLSYPGDPDLEPMAEAWLRDETLLIYDHGFVAIVQPDGKYQVARMD